MNPYEVIGVSVDAEFYIIRAAYKRRAQQLHPDKGGDKSEFATLAIAWSILKDPALRKHYDETGGVEKQKPHDLQVEGKLFELFNAVMDSSDFRGDIIAACRTQIQQALQSIETAKAQTVQQFDILTLKENRIICSSNTNLYEQLLASKLNNLSQQKEKLSYAHRIQIDVLALLDNYTDVRPDVSHTPTGSTSTTNYVTYR